MLAKGSVFFRFINKYWVNSKHVPLSPLSELSLDLSRPIIYIVEQNSASDLLALQSSCRQLGLPDPYQSVNIAGRSLHAVIYLYPRRWFSSMQKTAQQANYVSQYQELLDLHQKNEKLDIQLVPVTFYWGRDPGKEGKSSLFSLYEKGQVTVLHKALVVLKNGRDHLIRFNGPISIAALKNRASGKKQLAEKLAKIAKSYFVLQKRSSVGPKLPSRKEMIKNILQQDKLSQVITEHAQLQGKSESEIRALCQTYLQEISANFSYPFLRLFSKILGWVWTRIYDGIEVHHAQSVRQACQSGAEIIYMPCHRSHMDYLLLSYLLFQQGLVPPHVAAGVNLSFFPAGPIFRRSGAFFLRRSFKGSPLYAQVFKAYFAMLFKQGYPIEFFTEGGRSRTGRLLPPKTGLLAASLQTYLDSPKRNVKIIPVYIGYDHIMEVNSYIKELSGQKKEKESIWQLLGIVKKLGHFGHAFVSFGEPIDIKQHFDKQTPYWRDQKLTDAIFKEQVSQVANRVMEGINATATVNALPLCAAILLATKAFRQEKALFFQHIDKHQQLLLLICKNRLLSCTEESVAEVYRQALLLNKFSEKEGVVICSQKEALQLSYYRNNIIHLFVLPSLICLVCTSLLRKKQPLTEDNILFQVQKIYPFLQAEYFLGEQNELSALVKNGLLQLVAIKVLSCSENRESYQINDPLLCSVLQGHLQETFLRYALSLSVLLEKQTSWQELNSDILADLTKQLLIGKSIEAFDAKAHLLFLQTLQRCYPNFLDQSQAELLLTLFTAQQSAV